MAGYTLIDALPDFGAVRRPPARAFESEAAAPAEPPPPEPAETFTREELDRAASDARVEVEERMRAAHEAETSAMAAAHRDEIERLTRELGEQAGAAVAQRFDELRSELTSTTGAVVARILGVALTEAVTRSAVEQLAGAVTAALADRETVRLRVRGSPALFEALRPALGAHAGHAEFTEAPGLDLSIALDTSLFESRISEWSSALSEALAGARA